MQWKLSAPRSDWHSIGIKSEWAAIITQEYMANKAVKNKAHKQVLAVLLIDNANITVYYEILNTL